MSIRDIFNPKQNTYVHIFIYYIKNDHIITTDRYKFRLDHTSCVHPTDISDITTSNNIIDGVTYTLDDIISYNNTYHLTRDPSMSDVIRNHDGTIDIYFKPTSSILRNLNCIVIIMRDKKVKYSHCKTRKKHLYIVK